MTGDGHVMSVANMDTAGGHDWSWSCDVSGKHGYSRWT